MAATHVRRQKPKSRSRFVSKGQLLRCAMGIQQGEVDRRIFRELQRCGGELVDVLVSALMLQKSVFVPKTKPAGALTKPGDALEVGFQLPALTQTTPNEAQQEIRINWSTIRTPSKQRTLVDVYSEESLEGTRLFLVVGRSAIQSNAGSGPEAEDLSSPGFKAEGVLMFDLRDEHETFGLQLSEDLLRHLDDARNPESTGLGLYAVRLQSPSTNS